MNWDEIVEVVEETVVTIVLLKTIILGWAWWLTLVIPATQEAEAGELPEPRRRRLQ